MKKRATLFGLILTLILSCPGLARAQDTAPQTAQKNHVQVRLVPERTTVEGNDMILIAIEQTIDDGWHSYWTNPGDSGIAPIIKWKLPEGAAIAETLWPVPLEINVAGIVNYGYEKKVTLLQQLVLPDTLPAGPLTLEAQVDLLVCSDICIPETSTHSITLNDGQASDNTAYIDEAMNALPEKIDWTARYHTRGDFFVLDLDFVLPGIFPPRIAVTGINLIPYEWGVVENTAPTVTVMKEYSANRGRYLRMTQWRGDRPLEELKEIRALMVYRDANGHRMALDLTAAPDPAWLNYQAIKKARAALQEKPAPTPAPAATDAAAEPVIPGGETRATAPAPLTFVAALLFALLGGLVLNLMPCVFPVLSLKALHLSSMSAREQSHAALHGVIYTAGVLTSFALLGGLLMGLKAGGAEIGWGFQLQNPAVVYALALLLFALGLNLAGVFAFGGGLANAGAHLAARGGHAGDFFTGVLAVLVATPCTAPFMGAALGYALTQSAPMAFAVFMALGFGLALPYLLLTIVPPLRKLLPKPGAWMNTFKQFLAFPLFGSVAWLVWVFAQQTSTLGLAGALTGLIGLGFGLWAWPRRPAQGFARAIVTFFLMPLVLLMLAAPLAEIKRPHALPSAAPADESVISYTPAALDELLRGDNPIFVNMTAAWCITCKINEKAALDVPATKALFAQHNISLVRGDWTNRDAAITAYLDGYGRNGVPLYVFHGARDAATGQRPAPVVLPQLLTPALVREKLGY